MFSALAHNDARLKFHVAISSGAEMVTTSADYLAWMARQEEIKVVGMFLEAVRDADGFVAALELAANSDVPVVVLKVGRTQASAQMALSHTGAITGNDIAYRALFKRYGVIQVDDEDELAAALLLMGQPRRPARAGSWQSTIPAASANWSPTSPTAWGRLCAARRRDQAEAGRHHRSGTRTGQPTRRVGRREGFPHHFRRKLQGADGGRQRGGRRDVLRYPRRVLRVGRLRGCRDRHASGDGQPVALATNYAMVRHDELVARLSAAGVPVIDGSRITLKAVGHMFAWRDRPKRRTPPSGPTAAAAMISQPNGAAGSPPAGPSPRTRH